MPLRKVLVNLRSCSGVGLNHDAGCIYSRLFQPQFFWFSKGRDDKALSVLTRLFGGASTETKAAEIKEG